MYQLLQCKTSYIKPWLKFELIKTGYSWFHFVNTMPSWGEILVITLLEEMWYRKLQCLLRLQGQVLFQAEVESLYAEEYRLDQAIRLVQWGFERQFLIAVLSLFIELWLCSISGISRIFWGTWRRMKTVKSTVYIPWFSFIAARIVFLFNHVFYFDFRYLFLTEEDILALPCFQVIFLPTWEVP